MWRGTNLIHLCLADGSEIAVPENSTWSGLGSARRRNRERKLRQSCGRRARLSSNSRQESRCSANDMIIQLSYVSLIHFIVLQLLDICNFVPFYCFIWQYKGIAIISTLIVDTPVTEHSSNFVSIKSTDGFPRVPIKSARAGLSRVTCVTCS